MVTLRVGHPPCLWTDLLTCCKVVTSPHDNQLLPRWWIMHKSSCHEDFEFSEDMQTMLDATTTMGSNKKIIIGKDLLTH